MGKCICAIILLATGLEAQEKADLTQGVLVMQVERPIADYRPATLSSAGADRFLSALIRDPATEVLGRSVLHLSDGVMSRLRIGEPVQTCGTSLEITPKGNFSEEMMLHVVVFRRVNQECRGQYGSEESTNIFDVRVRRGQVTILSGNLGSPIVIALIPKLDR